MSVFPAIFGLFVAALVSGQDQIVEITPKTAVRRVGDELTILCKVPYKLDSCRIMLGNDTYRVTESISTEELAYSGQGLEMGECGVRLKSIKELWNGKVSCVLPPETGYKEVSAVMRLVVARAPGDPQLRGPLQPQFQEDETFTAQCIVPDGRPAATISWYLDEEPLLVGVHKAVTTSVPGSDLETISQNITRTLVAEDGGKKLTCMAEHEAFDFPRNVSRQLIVYYPPKRLDAAGPLTIFGLKLGAEGRLNVTVRSNPEPHPEWTVGDQRLVPGQSNDAATAQALPPLHLGGGYYNVTLVLHRVAKEDVDQTYYLRVNNDFGQEEFAVRISTMHEPAGVELETGAVVGIVIAVLVLLIAISLVVFAKATDRWCFGGGSRARDHTRSSGESSDTESAVGGKERSRLAGFTARMRAALPRAKDKVQATEVPADTEERPLSEDKKGVVYAELVLSEQPTAEKPPPPATEYAEIVYTDQPAQPAQPAQPKETKE